MKKLKSISVFYPILNDAKILPLLLKKTFQMLPKVASSFEVLVIDDGSTDTSPEVLQTLQKKYKKLRFIIHPKNLGYGNALISGFKNTMYDWVFYTDGDGQYDPTELLKLVACVGKDIDVVNGYKLHRSDPKIRKVTGWTYNKVVHILFDLPILDVDCDFRLIKRSFLKRVNLTSSSGSIGLELVLNLKQQNARFAEIGVQHYKRKYGNSEFFKISNISKMLYDVVVLFIKSRYFYLTGKEKER